MTMSYAFRLHCFLWNINPFLISFSTYCWTIRFTAYCSYY